MKYFIILFILLMMGCGSDDPDKVAQTCFKAQVITPNYNHCILTGEHSAHIDALTEVSIEHPDHKTILTFVSADLREVGTEFFLQMDSLDGLVCNQLVIPPSFFHSTVYSDGECTEQLIDF